MNLVITQELTQTWNKLQSLAPIYVIYNEAQYLKVLQMIDELLDIVDDDENHPLYDLLDTLSVLVQNYEDKHYSPPTVTGIEMLKYLMEEQGLTPTDFPEIGSAGEVTELMAGQRELSLANIRALARRFGLSPATFL